MQRNDDCEQQTLARQEGERHFSSFRNIEAVMISTKCLQATESNAIHTFSAGNQYFD
jgi:hypothetical protein